MITEEEVVNKLSVLDSTGQYDQLLYEVEEYLKDNPDFGVLYVFKGNALRERGDLDGALTAYRWAIMYDPNDVVARTNYASVLYTLKDYVGALNAADAAVLMEPDFADPYLICGNVLSLLGFPEQAMYSYHRALTFNPDNIILGAYVAELYSKQEEPEEAFNLLMQLLKIYPKNDALQLQMATTLAFFMQNGVPLKKVMEFVQVWQKEFDFHPIVSDVAPILLSRQMNNTPLTTERLSAAFDSMADFYDDANQDEAITFINMLENALIPIYANQNDLTALDIGCGTGLGAFALRGYTSNGKLIGVDISKGLLKQAEKKEIYTTLENEEILSWVDKQTEPFDVLIASSSLPFFKDLDVAFAKFNRILKESGMFFFSVRRNTLNEDDIVLYPPFSYIFSERYVRNTLKKNGFEIVSIQSMQDGLEEVIHDKKYFYVVKKVKNS